MINRDKVYTYFSRFHGPLNQSTNGWYECICPVCGQKKFAVNFNFLTGKCYRGCFNGFVVDVIRLYHGIGYFEARELIDEQPETLVHVPAVVRRAEKLSKIKLPVGYHPILDGDSSLAVRARIYLEGRKFDLNYLDKIGVGYCNEEHKDPRQNYFGYIIVPFKKEGCLNYFLGRDFIGNFERYKNPAQADCGVGKSEVFFNEEALWLEKKVYITEGWACAATIQRQGVSQQGIIPSSIQKGLLLKAPVEELILVPDAGCYVQGLQAAKNLMAHKKIKVINLDYFLKEKIGKDVNEIGAENLFNVEKETPYMDAKMLFRHFRLFS